MAREALKFQDYLQLRPSWKAVYFSLEELLWSHAALEHRLSNLPSREEFARLREFAVRVLDPIRELARCALAITSGYREPEVNAYAGGVPTSEHQCLVGAAADLRPAQGDQERIRGLYRLIAENATTRGGKLVYDEIVLYPNRIHVGWLPENSKYEQLRMVWVAKPGGGMKKTYPAMTDEELREMPEWE